MPREREREREQHGYFVGNRRNQNAEAHDYYATEPKATEVLLEQIAKYQKAVLRRTESKIRKQIEKLRADIERDSERLKSCHHLDERSCEDRLHEDVAKHTAMYDALKIVSDMVTELEWLSNWKD